MSSDLNDNDPILCSDDESDVSDNDSFTSTDYYSKSNEEYVKASPLPVVECPSQEIVTSTKSQFPKITTMKITYKEFTEQLIPIINPLPLSSYENEISISPETVLENYQISQTYEFNYSLNQYDVFSKKHHRMKLLEELNKIDWRGNEYKINEAKKTTNAYEEVFETFFHKHLAYKLANLNYLFKKELFTIDRIMKYTPIFIVGDNGGYSDYIQWFSYKNGFTSKIFLIPERNNSIHTAKFRREIEKEKDSNIEILNEFFNKCDLDENKEMSSEYIANIAKSIMERTDNYGVNFYIARKVIKYTHGYSREMQYKNFLLINILLCFQILNKGGNFVIKIYDSFSLFTVSLIYILYKAFEKITVIKPFSTRPYSSSRYIVCEKFKDATDDKFKIMFNYLNTFFDKYLELNRSCIDVQFVLPISEINKSENFPSLIMEINSKITEGRIEALMEITKFLKNEAIMRYDKMDIKKKCLDLWQIPVLRYDESELARNQLARTDGRKGHGQNKLKTLDETAKEYENFGKYSKPTEDLVSMLLGGEEKKEEEVKHTPKERELTQEEKDAQLARIFPNRKSKSNKKKNEQMINKKRNRKTNVIEDDDIEDPFKEKKPHHHHHHTEEKRNITQTEEVWKEVQMNREKVENEKIKLNDDIKAKLVKYMKK